MAPKIQTLARELALKALYQYDLLGGRTAEQLHAFCADSAEPEVAELAGAMVDGCLAHQDEVDGVIRRTAQNWKLERMAACDRNILRLGAYELLHCSETPPKVAINEAIELAKKFSTQNSPTFVNGVLDRIYKVHVTGELQEAATEEAAVPPPPMVTAGDADPEGKVDLHVHSTASDGSVAPEELPVMAAAAGLRAFALTDHDSVDGVAAAMQAAEAVGIEVVAGVELTGYEPAADGSGDLEVHVAGVFVDSGCPSLLKRLHELRVERVERVRRMCARLGELGLVVDPEDVLARADSGGAVGRVHMAQQMVEQGLCVDLREVFERYLGNGGPAYVAKRKMTPAQAVELVHGAGGCAVLCHPSLLADADRTVAELAEQGLDGLEVHYPQHSPQDEARFLELARRHGLVMTGGSDFHGDAKPDISLGRDTVSCVELEQLRERAAGRSETAARS